MHVITKINGKDALPVRAIPLLTDWQGLSPDGLAKILAGDSDHWPSFDGLTAYRLQTDGSIEAIPPRWWRSWVVRKLNAISDAIKAKQASHETGYQQWRSESLAQLPAGVFVWRDEFETAHTMEYGPEGARARSNPEGFDPSVHILNFNPHPALAIATLGMVLEGFNRAADGRPFDFPLTTVDAQRWQRFGELSVEEAAFVVAGFEPPPIAVIRYRPIPYQERPGATWVRPNEYDDFVRAATSAIERGNISARSKIQDMHTVQLVELFDVLEWAEATGFTVALKLDGPRPARKSAPVQSVESDSTPAAAPVVAEGANSAQRRTRRDILTPAIEAAQKECGDPFDAPAVWAVLVQMAQNKKRSLLGVSEDGIKWLSANDEPKSLNLNSLRDRLRRMQKKKR